MRLPTISPKAAHRLRWLYSDILRRARLSLENKGEGELRVKQVYKGLRTHPRFQDFSTALLWEAAAEAAKYLWHKKHQGTVDNDKAKSFVKWLRANLRLKLPDPIPGPPHKVSFPDYLKGFPGRRRGQAPRYPAVGHQFHMDRGEVREVRLALMGRIPIRVGGAQRRLLQRALKGAEGLRAGKPRLVVRDNAVFLAVPISNTAAPPIPYFLRLPRSTPILGVDPGEVTLLTTALLIPPAANIHVYSELPPPPLVVGGSAVVRRLYGERKDAARRGAVKQIQRVDQKVRRVTDYWAHVASRRLIEYAALLPASPLVAVEETASYRPLRRRTRWASPALRDALSKWPRGKLRHNIRHKAQWQGIPTVEVDPAFTSRTCLVCGTGRGALGRSRWFLCPVCGWRADRDVNAAGVMAVVTYAAMQQKIPFPHLKAVKRWPKGLRILLPSPGGESVLVTTKN